MTIANRESFAAARRRLPYDAEVEYLESTGTQWIDTGIDGRATLGYSFSGMLLEDTGSFEFPALLGFGFEDAGEYLSAIEYQGALDVGTPWTSILTYHMVDKRFTATANFMASGMITVDGYAQPKEIKNIPDIPGAKFCLFCWGSENGPAYLIKGRIYWVKISDGLTVVRDMIPVRFTNEQGVSEGAMYDRLGTGGMNPDGSARTDGLYRNRGTGAFLYGADKVA